MTISQQTLDRTVLQNYKISLGEDVIKSLIVAYIDDVQGRVKEIMRLHSEKQYVQLGREGHSIKGASANLGLLRLAELGKNLQDACEQNNISAVDENVRLLRGEMDLAIAELNRFMVG